MLSPEPTPEGSISRRIVATLEERAREARVAEVRIGLGYTAVRLGDQRTGVAYTFHEEARGGCSVFEGLRPLTGRPASDLLPLLESRDPIEAAVGLACANALVNHHGASYRDGDILGQIDLGPDDRVAMVGHFGPLVGPVQKRVRDLIVLERVAQPQGILRPVEEAESRLPLCQVALITGTAIINHTIDGLLRAARPCRVVAVLGASTPMLPEAFAGTAAGLLSGVVVEQPSEILRIVSEGGGMRQFKGYVRKVNMDLRDGRGPAPRSGKRTDVRPR